MDTELVAERKAFRRQVEVGVGLRKFCHRHKIEMDKRSQALLWTQVSGWCLHKVVMRRGLLKNLEVGMIMEGFTKDRSCKKQNVVRGAYTSTALLKDMSLLHEKWCSLAINMINGNLNGKLRGNDNLLKVM